MRTMKQDQHAGPTGLLDEETEVEVDFAREAEAEAETELLRVTCPDCLQPIALSAEDETLPVHALCPTPWNPFGLTVCPGSGRRVAGDAGPPPLPAAVGGGESAARLTLPEGLDWRLQPFSHASAALPTVRQAA